MNNKIIYTSISEIEPQLTTHLIGKKYVLVNSNHCESNIMQIAKGVLEVNEVIEQHLHPTMEEFYFFLSGKAEMWINNKFYNCSSETLIKVPANQNHFIKPISKVQFLYWSVAVK